jgi:hypothetical protein
MIHGDSSIMFGLIGPVNIHGYETQSRELWGTEGIFPMK